MLLIYKSVRLWFIVMWFNMRLMFNEMWYNVRSLHVLLCLHCIILTTFFYIGNIRVKSQFSAAVSVMIKLTTVNKINDTVIGIFNTGNKSRYMGTTIMETMRVRKQLLNCSVIDKGTEIEIGCNKKM